MLKKMCVKLSHPFPVMTCMLMGMIIVVFLVELLFGFASHQFTSWVDVVGIGTPGQIAVFREMGGAVSGMFQPWRLVSLLFLHAGIIHCGLNVSALSSFRDMEQRIGKWAFLVLFLFGGLCSGVGATIFLLLFPRTPFIVGASGGIWAIIIAYVVYEGRMKKVAPKQWLIVSIVLFLFMCLGNLFAHLAGACGGLLFCRAFLWKRMKGK